VPVSLPSKLSTPPNLAVRNGENSLPRLLKALSKQDYKGEMEFILVDDESTDITSKLIKEKVIEDSRFSLESSATGDSKLSRKKKALDAGIKKAKYEWLLFTDVDCLPPISWVRSIAAGFSEESDFVVGSSVFSQAGHTNPTMSIVQFSLRLGDHINKINFF